MEDFFSNTFQSSLQWSYTSPRSPFSLTTSARHSQNSLTGNVSMTLPSATLNMSRRSVSDLLNIDKGSSKVLDGITMSYSSRFENVAQIPDSSLASLDFSSMEIKSGLKHSISASSSGSLGFITFAPSFQSFYQASPTFLYRFGLYLKIHIEDQYLHYYSHMH